jgi:hypothetical protein
MPNLFIIGNGFDIAHGLPTKYKHFRQFLVDVYDADENISIFEPSITMNPDGGEYPDASEVASLVSRMQIDASIDSEWNCFEETLGLFDYEEFYDMCYVADKDGGENLWHTAYNKEDISSSLLKAIPYIQVLFKEWIEALPALSLRKPRFSSIIDPENDLFLNFNYTLTLEKVYGCKKVCHIHGKQGGKILVGHGDDTENAGDFDNRYYPGATCNLTDVKQALRKDTRAALELNRAFFNSIAVVADIYSIGFSYNDVDLIYIKEICRTLNTKPHIWTFHGYSGDRPKFHHFKETIRKCGFNGSFKEDLLIRQGAKI